MAKRLTQIPAGGDEEERAAKRKRLGTLSELMLRLRTRIRYRNALDEFFTWLDLEG